MVPVEDASSLRTLIVQEAESLLTGDRVHAVAAGRPPFVVKLTPDVGGVWFPLPTSVTVTVHVQGAGREAVIECEEQVRPVLVGRGGGGAVTAVSSVVAVLAASFASPG